MNTAKSTFVSNAPMGRMLKEFKELDKELGYSKIKEKDYELLDKIREMRNYWCHRCYIDFHYIEDEKEHYEAFLKVAEQLCHDENCIYELQQKIEKLSVEQYDANIKSMEESLKKQGMGGKGLGRVKVKGSYAINNSIIGDIANANRNSEKNTRARLKNKGE